MVDCGILLDSACFIVPLHWGEVSPLSPLLPPAHANNIPQKRRKCKNQVVGKVLYQLLCGVSGAGLNKGRRGRYYGIKEVKYGLEECKRGGHV